MAVSVVITSANVKDSQTPLISKNVVKMNKIGIIAMQPRMIETIKALFIFFVVALKKAAIIILDPAKKNPVKYNLNPFVAIGIISALFSLLKIAMI